MRAIDADALMKKVSDEMWEWHAPTRKAMALIADAPTIEQSQIVNISEGNYMAFALISKQALEEIHDDNWFCGAVAIDIMSWARGHGMDAKELAERILARVQHEVEEEADKE